MVLCLRSLEDNDRYMASSLRDTTESDVWTFRLGYEDSTSLEVVIADLTLELRRNMFTHFTGSHRQW